jgi:hypothetical protein
LHPIRPFIGLGRFREREREREQLKNLTNVAYRIDMWTDDGENIIEHLYGMQDFLLAILSYRAACERWPNAAITLREGARVFEESRRTRLASR